jgi:hypothetical protein
MFDEFTMWADNLPHMTMVFLCDGTYAHTIFAEAVGMCDDNAIIVQNELFAIHTTMS